MAYVSIYRKYRPSGFSGVVGQDHIVRILKNQIKNDNIGHAYLFTGTRGTGKTSIAKIFARAVNCLSPLEDGSPCGKCEACKSFLENNSFDIMEIDAASNNGVDEIRELRESVKYPPITSKYKVYIIDEVHMLSIGAFNALLKTLEEPPKYVVFILATTEVHKLPQTILSRCLRFDFRLVPAPILASRIKYIFDDMNVKYTDDAVLAIAEAGDGSVRDALSIADMCVSYSDGVLDYDIVLDVLGASNPNSLVDIIEACISGDVDTIYKIVEDIANYGKSMSLLSRDMTKMFRNAYIALSCNNPYKTLKLPAELIDRLLKLDTSPERLLRCVDIMSGVEANMRYSTMPRVLVEVALSKCADDRASMDLSGLSLKLKQLEEKVNNGVIANSSYEYAPIQSVKKKRPFDSIACCGHLIKSTRNLNKLALFSELSELEKKNFSFENGVVYITPLTENMYNNLSSKEYLTLINDLVIEKFEGVNRVEIKRLEKVTNIVDEIAKVCALFDNNKDIINIIEKKEEKKSKYSK